MLALAHTQITDGWFFDCPISGDDTRIVFRKFNTTGILWTNSITNR